MAANSLVLLMPLVLLTAYLVMPALSKGHGSNQCWATDFNNKNITCLHGEAGVSCDGTKCMDDPDISCDQNKCKCNGDYDKGDGIVVCAEPHEDVCYMVSDPRLKTFSNDRVSVYPSCKFLMSSFDTNIMDALGNNVGDCIVEGYTWGVKGRGIGRNGKHFTGGMEIKITVTYMDTIYFHATRINGEGRMGLYQFTEEGSNVLGGTYGYAIETVIPNLGEIYTEYDDVNNIAEVRADFCGVRMGFRPAEFQMAKEVTELDPGVYIKVDSLHLPTNYGGVCLKPDRSIQDVIDWLEQESDKVVDVETAMLYLLLKSSSDQNFPGALPVLQSLANTVQECEPKPLVCAIQQCMFIAKVPRFLKCYGKRTDLLGKDKDDEGSDSESSESSESESSESSESEGSESESSESEGSESSESEGSESSSSSGSESESGGGGGGRGGGGGGRSRRSLAARRLRYRRSGSASSSSEEGGKGGGKSESDSESDSDSESESESESDSDSESESDSDSESSSKEENLESRENRRMRLSLRLMFRCFQSFCSGSSMMCDIVKEKINATKCDQFIPENQQNIMDYDCDMLNTPM